MADFDYNTCPIGIKNGLEIEHNRETFDTKLDAMMVRIEEKIDNMNSKIAGEFDQLNERLDKLDKRIDTLDKKLKGVDNLESYVEGKINDSTKNKVFNFVKWIVTGLLAAGATAVFTHFLLEIIK